MDGLLDGLAGKVPGLEFDPSFRSRLNTALGVLPAGLSGGAIGAAVGSLAANQAVS